MTPLLEARGLAIQHRLRPTDLTIAGPSLVALVGPNGGGKTSLLRAIAGVEHSRGSVRIDDEDVAAAPPARRARLLSFLPASREVAWPIAARDIIRLGLPSPDEDRVEELLETFELSELAERPINRLSTGERSRVLLARAMAARPRLLLLDEPLSNLDPYWVLRTLEVLRTAVEQDRCAALISLHDLFSVERFDQAVLVDAGRLIGRDAPSRLLDSAALADAFRIEKADGIWRFRRPADRRSSP